MKEKIGQLKARYLRYSPRERTLIKLCGSALCCAIIWYGVMTPLDNIIKNEKATLQKQKQTLNWMRAEINKNHLQAKVLKTSNPRSVVEESAKEIHVALSNIQQDGQTLTFNIDRVNVYELKNWLREVNLTTGVRLEKMDLTPVDHLSDVKAQIKLSWAKVA
ncbi:TPA: type II secretion system protein M [Enterobacter cloacae]|jgi:general secretion pathway protein M|uniref:General secretion pathway protein M n=3 Tax=Enterobacter cloacae TaxID=550 RepID=A0A0H3CKA5_ENTCC|nr:MULTISPECIES: type II secretion system protein M [Enterobacter]ADF62330.1 general secretion pathway protein M [Enterobacter cloacae subsp. cloacae ATCC 13047]EGQ5296268.1 type II secretion system protein M [Enterobacter cloacae]EJD6655809.1 type II secretion system protein M [Enterobacter cloacae]EKM5717698.1 type II secretion system protein M [Enterobacter cloacae]EKP1125317.1 type II secretion system protein M [Enterobacter cloacae]